MSDVFYPLIINLFAAPANKTTSSGLSASMQTYYERKMLENVMPQLVHAQFADKYPIPQNNGKSISMRKWTPLTAQTTALTEGVPPTGQALAMTQVSANISQYGGFVSVSDLLDMVALDPVILGATELIANQAALTLDTLTRDAISSGTQVVYGITSAGEQATLRSQITAAHRVTLKTIHQAVLLLKQANAPRIDNSYVAIVHPAVSEALMASDEWVDVNKYAYPEKIFNGEIGKLAGVRFVETTNAYIYTGSGASSADVYSTLVFGAHAFATIDLEGGGLRHIVKQMGSAGSADPLNQMATVGWKAIHCAKIINGNNIVRIESGGGI